MPRPPLRLVALVGLAVLVGSCRKTDSPTDPVGPVSISVPVTPVLVPSPANDGAAPVNRIEVTIVTLPDSTTLGTITATATPGSTDWDVTVTGSTEATSLQVAVTVALINDSGGNQTVQFSGFVSPLSITPGSSISAIEIPLVRGPLANVFATGVSVDAAPDSVEEGETAPIAGSATTSGSVPPTVFWTVLDTLVLSATDSTVTGVAAGVTQLVASAGAFSDTTSVVVTPPPPPTDLTIEKLALAGTAFEGDSVGFELVVTNPSPNELLAVEVVDSLPAGLEPAPVPPEATWDANTRALTWTLDTLSTGAVDTIRFAAEVQVGTVGSDLTNEAEVFVPAGYEDPDETNNRASVDVSIVARPVDVAVTKTVDEPNPLADSTVLFTVAVVNNGPFDASDLLVLDALDTVFTAPSHVTSTGSLSGDTLWAIPSLAVGDTATWTTTTILASNASGGSASNSAILVSLAQNDTTPVNDTATVAMSFPVSALPDVVISVPADSSVFDPGEIVTFTGTATDAEDGPLTASLAWTSSLDGSIGSGGSFQTSQLSTGVHTVVASVTDSDSGEGADTITVNVALYSVPVTLNVPFSSTAQLPITLAEPAPTGGLTLTLSSSDEAVTGTTAPTVFIPEGALSANAVLEGRLPGVATVTASNPQFGAVSSAVSVTAEFDIVQSSVTVPGDFDQSFEIRFESQGAPIAAPAGGFTVTLTSRDMQCAAVPAEVVIPAGLTSEFGTTSYGGGAARPCDTYVQASAPGVTPDSVRVFVEPVPGFVIADEEVGSGLMVPDVAFLGASEHGGVTARIESIDPGLALVSVNTGTAGAASVDIPVLDGQTRIDFTLHGVEGIVDDTARIVLSAPGFANDTIAVAVVQPGFDIAGLAANGTTFTADDAFTVRVGLMNAGQTALQQLQAVRVGGTTLNVTVTSSDPLVGDLVTLPDSTSPVALTIVPGASQTPSSVATGGVALSRDDGGTTTVSATVPGLFATNNASQLVTISTPAISFGPEQVASGLMRPDAAFLGASQHGGVTVKLKSLDTGIALLSLGTGIVGDDSVQVSVPNGSTRLDYVLHALEGIVVDTARVELSAPGFTTDTMSVAVSPAGYDIAGLSPTGTTFTADDAFQVRVGLMNAAQTALQELQSVRAGAPSLNVTVTSSDPLVGDLVTLPDSTSPVSLTIDGGSSTTPSSVAAGGVALSREDGGETTVSASIPGLVATGNAVRTVTISTPGISTNDEQVASGLMLPDAVFLGASQHGGVTVTLRSLDDALALVSPNTGTVGIDSFDVAVVNGQTRVDYVIHALEGIVDDTARIELSAPGFSTDTLAVLVSQPGYDIAGLSASKNSFSPDDVFQVRVGLLNSAQTALQQLQAVRTGSSPLDVTVTSSQASVGVIVGVDSTAAAVSAEIAVGSSSTPNQVATGGIAFRTQGFGMSTVAASIPGNFAAANNASIDVTVDAPGISVGDRTLGSGLMVTAAAFLGAAEHGGVLVRVESSSPSVYTVSTSTASVGETFVDIFVPNGQTRVDYVLHGIEGITNPVSPSITLSAPGFTNGAATVTVVQPAIDISGLFLTQTAGGGEDPFTVRVGIPNGTGTALQELQAVRAGAGALTATVTTSDAGAAPLVTTPSTGASVTVQIGVGATASPSSVATGGVALDPLAAGSTTVAATIPGYLATGNATRSVTINP